MDFPSSKIPSGDRTTSSANVATPDQSVFEEVSRHPHELEPSRSLSDDGGMFLDCKQCGVTGNLVCEHSRELIFRACISFKNKMQSISPCKNANEVCEMNQKVIPDKLSDTFVAFEVEGNGNCLYSSISVCMVKDTSIESPLRQATALEIIVNPEIDDMLSRCNIPSDEVLQGARNGVWGNETSMFLVSSVIGMRIEVQELTCNCLWRSTFYDANPSGSGKSIHVYLHENHFSPLIPRNPYTQLPAAMYSPAPFRHGNDSYFQSLAQRGGTVEIVDLSNESMVINPYHGASFDSMLQFRGPVKYFNPEDFNFNIKFNKLNAILLDLECAETKRQYVEACTKHKIRAIPKSIHENSDCPRNSMHKLLHKATGNNVDEIDGTKTTEQFKTVSDGKFKPDLEGKFDQCLKSISDNIRYLQQNKDSKECMKSYILQCISSRSHWIVLQSAPGKQLTKQQMLQREKHSKMLFKMLKKSVYQAKFTRMINACGESHSFDSWETNPNTSHHSFDFEVNAQTEDDPASNPALPSTNSICSSAVKEISQGGESTEGNVIGMEAIADVLNISIADLQYEPPIDFDICINPEHLSDIFDFTTGTFIKRQWAKGISRALTLVQGACCFKAQHQPTYHQKENSSFATLDGRCGCGLTFIAIVHKKPVKEEALEISVMTKGAFHLMQEKFTGRPLSGKERTEIAKRLEHVKAEAIFLENMHHLPALRLLHGNNAQSSREVLRKAKSEKKLESRLDPDPMEDLLKQQIKYEKASHPKASVRGYIQYVNGSPGNFKIILFDQGSLSLHIDQAQKRETICYMDATGGVISKINGKEVLLYRLLGRSITDCTYEIAEMLSEKGTTVELTDFLKRIKHGVMQIRPSFSKPMADIVVVDWSWPLLHSVANGWNTETIQDYVTRSFAVLSETNSAWGSKCCIFICTSHLINAFYRNLCKRLHTKGLKKSVMPYALASIARLQESFSLEELRSVTRDITRLFGHEQLACSTVVDLCGKLQQHKCLIDQITEKDIFKDSESENAEAIELANSKTQKLVREKSPFYHVFKIEREKQMQIKEDDATVTNPFYCPVVLDVLEKDKIAMFPFWAAAIPRKVIGSNDFLRETNSTVESSFNQMKHIQSQTGRVLYADFVKHRYNMHAGKNRDTLSKLVRLEVRECAPEKPTQLLKETWKKKVKKCGSHFSAKTTINSKEKLPKSNDLKMSETEKQCSIGAVSYPEHGIPNIGNTCYMNAALQILLSIPLLWHHTDPLSDVHFFLRFMYTRLRDPELPSISVEIGQNIFELVKNMFKESKVTGFQLGLQHDATEFLRRFINLPQMSRVKDNFTFSLVNSYSCSTCNYKSELPGVVMSLDISIRNGFVTGINDFLNNPEMSECSECKSITLSHHAVFANKPQYLIITTDLLNGNLDRHGNFTLQKTKSNNFFLRNLEIDDVIYDLQGMICHRGIMADSGHYVAYLVKGSSLMCCDDDTIILDVENPKGDIYLYMYRKVVSD